jgi:hypothetical protein
MIYFPKCSIFSTIQSYAPDVAFYYFLKVNQFAGEKSLRLVECYFCHDSPAVHFMSASCIICCQATQILEMLHICQLCMITMFCTGDGCFEVLITTHKLINGYQSFIRVKSVVLSVGQFSKPSCVLFWALIYL